jgi:hypothetical protein
VEEVAGPDGGQRWMVTVTIFMMAQRAVRHGTTWGVKVGHDGTAPVVLGGVAHQRQVAYREEQRMEMAVAWRCRALCSGEGEKRTESLPQRVAWSAHVGGESMGVGRERAARRQAGFGGNSALGRTPARWCWTCGQVGLSPLKDGVPVLFKWTGPIQ